MWEFLRDMLEKGGVAATVLALVVIGCGIAIRHLWRENQALQAQIRTITEQYAQQTRTLAETYVTERKQQSHDFAARLVAHSERVDDLQERRIKEARDLTERAMSYMQHFDQFAAKLETLIEMIVSERRRGS